MGVSYEKLLAEHGPSAKGVGWGSEESQRKRFDVLFEIGIGRQDSVLDVGCGSAAFYAYLRELDYEGWYTGVDESAAMIEEAKKRWAVELVCSSIMKYDEPSDWVVASGLFWDWGDSYIAEAMMRDALDKMWEQAKKGMAFNFLSSWGGGDSPSEKGLLYVSPLVVLGWARNKTPWVTLRHDYMPHDATLFMYREKP